MIGTVDGLPVVLSTKSTSTATEAGAGSRAASHLLSAGSTAASGVRGRAGMGFVGPAVGAWMAVRRVRVVPEPGVRMTSGSGGVVPLAKASSVPADRS